MKYVIIITLYIPVEGKIFQRNLLDTICKMDLKYIYISFEMNIYRIISKYFEMNVGMNILIRVI